MSNLGISANNMQRLAMGVNRHMKIEKLQAGLTLLNKGRIVSLLADNSGYRLRAKVKDLSSDDMVYDLTIDVELFQFSKCSCEESHFCVHIAAAFLLAYSMSGHNADSFAGVTSKRQSEKSMRSTGTSSATQNKDNTSNAAQINKSQSNENSRKSTASPSSDAASHAQVAAEHEPAAAKEQAKPSRKLSDAWKQALSHHEVIVSSQEASASSSNNSISTVEPVEPAIVAPYQSAPASIWHRYMDDVLVRLLKTSKQSSDVFVKRGEALLAPLMKQWDAEHQALFELHMSLSIIHHTFTNMNTIFISDNYSNTLHTSQFIANIIDKLYENAQTIDWLSFFAQHQDRAEELQLLLPKYAFDCSSIEYAESWLELYRMIWGRYMSKADGSEEVSRLQRTLKRAKSASVEHEHISMALAYWDFRSGNDAGAIKRMEKLRHPWNLGLYLTYPHTRLHYNRWTEVLQWLYFIASKTVKQSYGYAETQYTMWSKLFDYWAQGVEASDNTMTTLQQWQAWLLDYISYLYDDYEDYLLERKRYKEWFDIMLCTDREPDQQHYSLLTKLEKTHPELLLPFYHQNADYWIGRKNRDGYRNAVFTIKKLALLYKRMNNTSGWERYVSHLTTSFSRYRAFQEELKKGNVIS